MSLRSRQLVTVSDAGTLRIFRSTGDHTEHTLHICGKPCLGIAENGASCAVAETALVGMDETSGRLGTMMTDVRVAELVRAVDAAFAVTGRAHVPWPNPHADRGPADDEYSRVTGGEKWRIIGARADAWLSVLGEGGLAAIERDASVVWTSEPGTRISRADRAVPRRAGALPLVLARSAVGDVSDAGVTLGVGDPAECVAWLPDCGCDACDSGSENELSELDRHVIGVVSGTFRRLTAGRRQITQLDASGWSASGSFGRREVDAILADPRGWQELSGATWTDLD